MSDVSCCFQVESLFKAFHARRSSRIADLKKKKTVVETVTEESTKEQITETVESEDGKLDR